MRRAATQSSRSESPPARRLPHVTAALLHLSCPAELVLRRVVVLFGVGVAQVRVAGAQPSAVERLQGVLVVALDREGLARRDALLDVVGAGHRATVTGRIPHLGVGAGQGVLGGHLELDGDGTLTHHGVVVGPRARTVVRGERGRETVVDDDRLAEPVDHPFTREQHLGQFRRVESDGDRLLVLPGEQVLERLEGVLEEVDHRPDDHDGRQQDALPAEHVGDRRGVEATAQDVSGVGVVGVDRVEAVLDLEGFGHFLGDSIELGDLDGAVADRAASGAEAREDVEQRGDAELELVERLGETVVLGGEALALALAQVVVELELVEGHHHRAVVAERLTAQHLEPELRFGLLRDGNALVVDEDRVATLVGDLGDGLAVRESEAVVQDLGTLPLDGVALGLGGLLVVALGLLGLGRGAAVESVELTLQFGDDRVGQVGEAAPERLPPREVGRLDISVLAVFADLNRRHQRPGAGLAGLAGRDEHVVGIGDLAVEREAQRDFGERLHQFEGRFGRFGVDRTGDGLGRILVDTNGGCAEGTVGTRRRVERPLIGGVRPGSQAGNKCQHQNHSSSRDDPPVAGHVSGLTCAGRLRRPESG